MLFKCYSTGTIHINVYGPIYIHILCPYHNMEDAWINFISYIFLNRKIEVIIIFAYWNLNSANTLQLYKSYLVSVYTMGWNIYLNSIDFMELGCDCGCITHNPTVKQLHQSPLCIWYLIYFLFIKCLGWQTDSAQANRQGLRAG